MDKINKLINKLEEHKVDGFFIIRKSNVNYISKFSDECAYIIITLKGKYLITDGRFYELACKECKDFKILNWQKEGSIVNTLSKICHNDKVERLAFEKRYVTYDMFEKLNDELWDLELVPCENFIEDLRYVKEEEEVNLLKKAAEITDKSFSEIIKYIKIGMSENEIAAKLEYIMKINGAEGKSFETILISGKKTSLPHGKPSNKKIEEGEFITLDFGALYKGYHADMTRTIIMGSPSDEQKNIYYTVKRAQEEGIKSITSGIKANVPDKIIREICKEYIRYYYPGIGHGVGLELYENPFIGESSNDVIKENCVLTVEPGLYIPDFGGVRIEDMILVREKGVTILTKSEKELNSI